METTKSYTDIDQAKALAKILPLESADMCYRYYSGGMITGYGDCVLVKSFITGKNVIRENDLPCWSLAALISIIPQELFDGEYIINITEGIDNKWIITYDHHENRNHSYYGLSTGADNLVDACTDIIIKFKERNII